MKIDSASELGRRLKTRRVALGRTIAAVAVQAGLSVPYIANLENGRGNPTIAALSGLAGALGAELRVELLDADSDAAPAQTAALPESLLQFARLPRFAAEVGSLAETAGVPRAVMSERLLLAMAGVGAVGARLPTELDWHRLLDVVVLMARR